MISAWLWSRPVLPLTASLAAGIGATTIYAGLPPGWLVSLLLGLLLLLAILIGRRWPTAWVACLLFFTLGYALAQQALHPPLVPGDVRTLPPQTPLSLLGVVQGQPWVGEGRGFFDLAVQAWFDGQVWRPGQGLVRVYGGTEVAGLAQGDTVVGRLRLRPVASGPSPAARQRRVALARQGIFTFGYLAADSLALKLASEESAADPRKWRQAVRLAWARFLATQPQPAQACFQALLLGEPRGISPELRRIFQHTGTSHLLAISGLHLGMITLVGYVVLFWLLRRSAWLLLRVNALKIALFLAPAPMLLYAWLAGGSPATQRAAVMIMAALCLILVDRPKDPISLLALAALLILVISPLQLLALSFQLSFLSVWGLLVLAPVMEQGWRRFLDRLAERPFWQRQLLTKSGRGLATTVAATLATLPVIVSAFHLVPTYGVLVNLLVVPLFGFLILPLSFLAVLLSGLMPPVAVLLLTLSRSILDGCLLLLAWAAKLPGVAVRLPSPTLGQIVAYGVLLSALFLARDRRWRWLGVTLSLVAMSAPVVWSSLQTWGSRDFVLTGIAGSRDLALVAHFPGGESMVISAGDPQPVERSTPVNTALLGYLQARQRLNLRYLVALTLTSQNIATALALVQELSVPEFWYNGERPPLPAFWELRNYLGDQRRIVKNLSLHPATLEIGGVEVVSRQVAEAFPGRTSGPVMLSLTYQGRKLLVLPPAGSAWRERCLAAGLPPSHILVLPARNIQEDFIEGCLAQVKPAYVVITGWPTQKNLALLAAAWTGQLFLTQQGEVVISLGTTGVHVQQN